MRFVLSVLALSSILPCVSAKLEARKPLTLPASMQESVLSSATSIPSTQQVPVEPPAEAVMTSKTKIFLDGAACEYARIPPTAEIAKMELDSDGKTILRIEFRSVK